MADNRLAIELATEYDNLRKGFLEAKALTSNYTDFVKTNLETQSKYEKSAQEKTIAEIRESRRKAMQELEANYKQAQEKAQGNAIELKKIDENYVKSKKNLYEQGEKDILRATAKWKDDVNDIIRDAAAENEKTIHKTKQTILADLEDQYNKEVALARKAGESIDSINKQHAAQKSHIGTVGVSNQPGLPGFGGIMSKEATASMSNFTNQMGPVGGVISALGPAGIAAGAGIAIAGAAMKESLEVALEYEKNIAKITTLLNEEQQLKLPNAMMKLRDAAKETGAPLTELQNTMYNLIGSVPIFANDLDAAALASANAAKLGKALGASTDAVALAMGNLGNSSNLNLAAMEDQVFVMDALAQTMNAGVIPSGEMLAQNIAKAAPGLAALTENGRDAIKINGALTAAFTQNGLSVDTAQDRIKAFTTTLANADDRMALIKAGLKGVTATGKITDIKALAESMGQDISKFTSLIGSQEAVTAMQLIGKQGGEAFKSVMEGFENMSGMAGTMYDKMAATTQTGWERIKAISNDIFLTVGQNGTGTLNSVANATASVLELVDNALQSAETKYQKAHKGMQEQGALANHAELSIQKVNQALAQMDVIGPQKAKFAMKDLGIDLQAIAEKAGPGAAAEIKRLMDSQGPLGERLEKIKLQLEAIDAQAKTQQAAQALTAQKQAGEALNEVVQEQGNWWQRNLSSIVRVGEYVAGGLTGGLAVAGAEALGLSKKLQDMENVGIMENMTGNIDSLTKNYDSLVAKSKTLTQGSDEYNKTIMEAANVAQQLNGLKDKQNTIEKATTEFVKRSIESQTVLMQGHLSDLDVQKAYVDAIALAPPELAKSVAFQEKIRSEITTSLDAIKEKAALDEQIKNIAFMDGEQRTAAIAKMVEGKTTEAQITEIINAAKASGLSIENEILDANIKQKEATLESLKQKEAHGIILSEEEVSQYNILTNEIQIANQKKIQTEYQNNKNSLLIGEQAISAEISKQTDDILKSETLTFQQKKEALELMIAQNEAEIYSLSLIQNRTAAQEAEIENLRVANNVIKDKLKGIVNADNATKLMSNTEKQAAINNLKNIKAENEAKISVYKNALTGINAIIKGESIHGKVINDVIKAQNELNKAKGVSTQGTVVSTANAEAMKAEIEAEIGKLSAANANIDKNIATLQKANITAPKTGGGGGAGAADKAKKDDEKAAEDLRKIMDDYNKAIKKAEEDYKNEMKKIAFEREKLRITEKVEGIKQAEAARKHAEDRAKAEREIEKRLQEFADNLKNKVDEMNKAELANISQRLSTLLTPLQAIEIEYQKLLDIQRKYIKSNEQEIAQKTKQLAEEKKKLSEESDKEREAAGKALEYKKQLGDVAEKDLEYAEKIAKAKKTLAEVEAENTKNEKLNAELKQDRKSFATNEYKKAALLLNDSLVAQINAALPSITAAKTRDEAGEVAADKIRGISQEVFNIGAGINNTWTDFFTKLVSAYKTIPDDLKKGMETIIDTQKIKDRITNLETDKQKNIGGNIPGTDISKEQISTEMGIEKAKETEAKKAAEEAEKSILKLTGELTKLNAAQKDIKDSLEAQLAEIVFRLREYQVIQKNIATIQDQINRETNPETRAQLQKQLDSEYALLATIEEKWRLEGKNLETDKLRASELAKQIQAKKLDQEATTEQRDAYYKAEALIKNITELTGELAIRQSNYSSEILHSQLLLYFVSEAQKEIGKIQKDNSLSETARTAKIAAQYEALNKLLKEKLEVSIRINEANKIEEEATRAKYEKGEVSKADLDKAVKNTQDSTKAVTDNTKALADNTDKTKENNQAKADAPSKDSAKDFKEKQENAKKAFDLDQKRQTQEALLRNFREAQFAAQEKARLEERQKTLKEELNNDKLSADQKKKLQDELADNEGKILDLGKQHAVAIKEGLKGAADELESINNLVTESITDIQNIDRAFRGKNTGQAIAGIGATTKKIGSFLMSFPDPSGVVPAIGAAMFLGGEITEIVGKIIASIKGKHKTQADIARDQVDAQRKINDEMARQAEILDDQIASGRVDLDQAWEKHAALEAQLNIMREQLGIGKEMTAEEAKILKDQAEQGKKKYEDLIADAEKLKEGSREDREKFLIASGFRSKIKPGENTKDILDNFITWAGTQVDAFGVDADKWGQFIAEMGKDTQAFGEILGETKEVASGVVGLLKDLNVTGPYLNQALNMALEAQRAMLEESFAGIKDLTKMTDDQIKEYAKTFGSYSTEYLEQYFNIGPDQIKALQEWLALQKQVTQEINGQASTNSAANEEARKSFEHRKKELDYLYAIGQITDAERQARLKVILDEELVFERNILSELELQHASNIEIANQKEIIWDLEKEIYATINGQNSLQDAQLKKVKALNLERNQMLMSMKLGGGIDQARLTAIEEQIIQGLRDAGATDEQIQMQLATFRNTMPQFAEGTQGVRTREGIAMLHDNEAVLNQRATAFLDRLSPGFIDSINRGPDLSLLETIAGNYYRSKAAIANRNMQTTKNTNMEMGGIHINIYASNDPKATAQEVAKQIEKTFAGRGIQIGGL